MTSFWASPDDFVRNDCKSPRKWTPPEEEIPVVTALLAVSQFPSPISTPTSVTETSIFPFLKALDICLPILVPIQYGFPWQSDHLQVSPPHKGWRSSILQISASMDSSINASSSTKKWPIFWNPHPVAEKMVISRQFWTSPIPIKHGHGPWIMDGLWYMIIIQS